MTSTKIITNTIYFAGLSVAMIPDFKNFPLYYGVVFLAIQIVFIAAEYVLTNRTIPHEALLIKNDQPSTLKDLLLVIPFTIAVMAGINLLFRLFTTKYLVTYISIGVLSAIIQYLIVKGKSTATLLIDRNKLIVNELFIKTYDLELLKSINFDGLYETYIAEFADSKRISIRQGDFSQNDLNKFIAVMTTKSCGNVVLSDNIRNEITFANK